jgi:signal transduction histidine kinase
VEAGVVRAGIHAALVVEDAGAGISQETLEHVFEPFYTTKGSIGNGLGLSIVYGIVTQSGGAIKVESTPGAGSRFIILLPRVTDDFRTPTPPFTVPKAPMGG